MSYVRRLVLENWLCYRGVTELAFEPKAYSVTASSVDDPEESNAAGKSALFESVRFALYGSHRWRRDDEWIMEGEKSGRVLLEMSDGLEVERSRERGKPTQLRAGKAKGERAQEEVLAAVGLTEGEFLDVAYCEQKELSRAFVSARPGERFRAASAWFRLEKLSAAEDLALDRLKGKRSLLEAAEGKLAAGGPAPDPKEAAEVGLELDAARIEEATIEASLRECLARRAAREERTRYDVRRREIAAEVPRLVAEIRVKGWARKDPLEEAVEATKVELQAAFAEKGVADGERYGLKVISEEGFDGRCPVSGISCPARGEVEAAVAGNRGALAKADAALSWSLSRVEEAQKRFKQARENLEAGRKANQRLKALREEAARLGPESGIPDVGGEASDVLGEHLRAVREKVANLSERARELARAAEEEGRLSSVRTEAAGLRWEMELLRASSLAFREARRRLAEEGLQEVQGEANALLASCGVPLSLKASWEVEGGEPAKHCRACGSPFPASAKVKACASCGAARGLNVVERLDLILSKRSGAMEDLAGAAVRLSAGAWVRRDRAVPWGTLLIDEPFGALDPPKRRSFGKALATMLLGATGAEQAFVTAHSPEVLAMLPGQVRIVASHKGSRAMVVA